MVIDQELRQQLAATIAQRSVLTREVRRSRVLSQLVREGYREAAQAEEEAVLVRTLLHMLLKTGLLDAVALFKPQANGWICVSQLGHWQGALPSLSPAQPQLLWSHPAQKPGFLSGILAVEGFKKLAFSSNSQWALLLGLKQQEGFGLNLNEDELPFLEAVLSLFAELIQRFQMTQSLKKQTTLDSLTGLPNRVLAFDRLQQAIVAHEPQDGHVMVMFIDLVRFKDINDIHGHWLGDQLLTAIANRWRAALRPADTLARLASDQFLVILERASKAKTAEVVAGKLLDCLKEPFRLQGKQMQVEAHIGIAMYPEDGADPSVLIRNADAAMALARGSDDSPYRFFTPALNESIFKRLEIENALRQALANNEFELVYQPQVSISDNQVVGVEALLRWHNPKLGTIPPDQFIPIAEEDGQILPIGLWVLETACQQLAAWRETGFQPVMSVNLSARQLRTPELHQHLTQLLKQYQLSPGQLELELTERAVLDASHPQVQQSLYICQKLGVGLALDDFGTGFSSLKYLTEHPFNVLKIDKSFVQALPAHNREYTLVAALIAIAQKLKMDVVAEGVETAEQLAILQSLQCPVVQGYYFSRPLQPKQLLARLYRQGQQWHLEP
ncbi:putative bifunctional diguanylate cyclase/phosphodiesterase [Gallaecimonas mangrovi]|uniref:putative bifunctional diguanylate cyclase/phosphodiesterase n=1 Tax=Gallaecimonas mangrovi TaxID=2291597 RepID=UPI000E209D77|nr:EAL domain-containing protein [Gallaecimonas mangrovi]